MASVIITSPAERELADSLEWYAERSIDAAVEFEEAVSLAIEAIASDPERFPLCDPRHRRLLLRRFPFQIVYRMIGDEIYVIAIAHTSRDSRYWANR